MLRGARHHLSPELTPIKDRGKHPRPYIAETATMKSLHFSVHQIQSRMDLRRPDALDLEYTRTMMGFLLFEPDPARVLMVGLGGGSLAKFCHRHLPRCRIDVVEINPYVIALRHEFRIPDDDDRFMVHEADGAEFVRMAETRYSALLIDGYDGSGVAPSLTTQRFFDDCFERLADHGVLVVNLDSSREHHGPMIERIRRSFGDVLLVRDTFRESQVLFARRHAKLESPRDLNLRCPPDFDPTAWESLQKGRQRLLEALRKERW